MPRITAIQIANRIILFCNDHGDLITNLKLQKLLYYSQAWHLAIHDKALFDEDFQAWIQGPTAPRVYGHFKRFRWNPISVDPKRQKFSSRVEGHIVDVMEAYSGLSSYDLERLTHQEDPWRKARAGLPPDEPSTAIISRADMKKCYGARLGAVA